MKQVLRVGVGWACLSVVSAGQGIAPSNLAIPEDVTRALRGIDEGELRQTVEALTSGAMEGRGTPSAGLEKASSFLSDALRRAGVQPQSPREYRQPIPIVDRIWDRGASSAELDGKPLVAGEDFFPTPAVLDGGASGPMVYVGHGFQVPTKGMNPYAGVDVRGKIVVTTSARPRDLTPADTPGTPGAGWHDARTYALANGAVGLVIIPTKQLQGMTAAERLTMALQPRRSPEPLLIKYLPALAASPALIRAMFADAAVPGDAVLHAAAEGTSLASFELPTLRRLTFYVGLIKAPKEAGNVIGVIPGSDPDLRHEYVIVGAHYDHLGVREENGKRVLYPGADDNASGTAAVVAIARALAKAPRPRRSVMVVFFASEEWFHEGSRHIVSAPLVPLTDIVTMINLDMVGRSRPAGEPLDEDLPLSGPMELHVQGARLTSQDLDERVRLVFRRYGSLTLDGSRDEPPYPFFWGSDHAEFAQAGVPALFFSSGMHADHHKPTDSADKLDYTKMRRVAHDVALLAWHLADFRERPLKKALPAALRP